MLEFKKLTLDGICLYRHQFGCNQDRICDCTAGTTFMWREFFQTEYTIFHRSLILKFRYVDGQYSFAFPLGGHFPLGGNYPDALSEIYSYCKEKNEPMRFSFTSRRDRDILISAFPDCEVISVAERDWFDYVYNASDIVNLSGKKYHGQKNHVNKFRKTYPDYRFVEIDSSNVSRVRDYIKHHLEKFPKEGAYIKAETTGMYEALDNYEIYGMCGGFIEVDGNIAGVSMGEIIGDTLYVHIEKADTDYQGAYSILTNEFAKAFVREDTLYINREEDMGEEGLRKSKLSYHPAFLAEKYTVTVKIK